MPTSTFVPSETTIRLVAVSLGPSRYFRDIVTPSALAVVTFRAAEALPSGPMSVDFNLAPGNQEQSLAGNAAAGRTYTLQLVIEDAPEIKGWSVHLEYDPTQVSYVAGSFSPPVLFTPE